MFLVQGISEILREPEQVRQQEEAYDDLLHQTPGILWNLYFRSLTDPRRTIHLMAWRAQQDSEAFGVSPAFQALRERSGPARLPRARMVGPLSPGYWELVTERRLAPPPTGRDPAQLGYARHLLAFVRPGQEPAWEAAARAQAAAAPASGEVVNIRVLRNRGQPNAYCYVAHTRTEAAARALPLPLEAVEEASEGVYQVILSSHWPSDPIP
ncbi:MAG: hypothetical protein KatS3mg061_2957 [Dehalococcoidia bacterium]|nr:MAG: hypothetical protein KatS3mg061_2957 [Dehalococcoidia bacterium]